MAENKDKEYNEKLEELIRTNPDNREVLITLELSNGEAIVNDYKHDFSHDSDDTLYKVDKISICQKDVYILMNKKDAENFQKDMNNSFLEQYYTDKLNGETNPSRLEYFELLCRHHVPTPITNEVSKDNSILLDFSDNKEHILYNNTGTGKDISKDIFEVCIPDLRHLDHITTPHLSVYNRYFSYQDVEYNKKDLVLFLTGISQENFPLSQEIFHNMAKNCETFRESVLTKSSSLPNIEFTAYHFNELVDGLKFYQEKVLEVNPQLKNQAYNFEKTPDEMNRVNEILSQKTDIEEKKRIENTPIFSKEQETFLKEKIKEGMERNFEIKKDPKQDRDPGSDGLF